MLVFKHVEMQCDCNPSEYDEDEANKITYVVSQLTREISIDRTYVDYQGTKYEKTFITEEGWNGLCQLLSDTAYGKKADREDNEALQEMYKLMIVQYVYQCLEDLGYQIEDIHLEVANDARFMVEILEDKTTDNYPGKWQTWETSDS